MGLIEHAKKEFKIAGYDPNDKVEGPDKWIQENVIELLKIFSDQGHSGSSAPYCISMFSKLAKFEPLTPLSGDDSEWMEVSENLWQNVLCSHVFKDNKGAWDIYGKIFRYPDGSCVTRKESHVPVTFPYEPKREYVDITE